MKISEVIYELSAILSEQGDVEVVGQTLNGLLDVEVVECTDYNLARLSFKNE